MFQSIRYVDKLIAISQTTYLRGSCVESVKESPDDQDCCVVRTKSGEIHRVEMSLAQFVHILCNESE